MKRFVFALLVAVLPALLFAKEPSAFKYPEAPKSDQVDDYHGTKVPDPYRPLENADSPESRAWIEAQNKLTFDFLESIPERKKINDRLTKLWNYEKFGVPYREGRRRCKTLSLLSGSREKPCRRRAVVQSICAPTSYCVPSGWLLIVR